MKNKVFTAIYETLAPEFSDKQIDFDSFPESESLITAGVIDSFAFVNILLALEMKLNISIDFSSIDLSDITSIAGIKELILRCAE